MEDQVSRAFRRHYAQVFRYLRRRTGSVEEAEDLAQAVFADAAERLADFKPGSSPVLAWLYTVARRRLADQGRQAARSPGRAEALAVVRVEGSEEQVYGRAVAEALREAITALPAGQRQVVVLKLLQGRTFADIADRTGASEAACKMRFARGLEAVRGHLRDRGVEP